ncbi:MAG TPA: hypothetical protein VMU16_03765 [Candidatus Binataceae bacterium]|nr:hypothetical protein [Candidatus Binataceae bacterium]
MWRGVIVIFVLVCTCGIATAGECAKDKRVVAACYDVHGRIRMYANMRPYLWPIGTKRLLGIFTTSEAPDVTYFWPDYVARKVGLQTDLFGDFRVCPFTPKKEGRMQMVCIDSASNLIAKPIRQ